MRAEYREEPCKVGAQPREGHAVRLVAQPVHGLRPPLHVLLRPRLRAARRPARGRALRHVDPRQGQRRRGAAARARRARSWRGEPVAIGAATDPYQPAEGRYRLTRALPRGARRRREPVLADHPRAADRARRRRARRGGAARRRLGHVLGADARPRGLAAHGAGHGAAAAAAARALAPRRRGHPRPRSGWRRSCPGISDRPEQLAAVVRAAREAGACGIWANVLHLKPGTREHFLESLARDWPELLPSTSGSTAARLPAAVPSTAPIRDGRARARTRARHPRPPRVRLAPPPRPSS